MINNGINTPLGIYSFLSSKYNDLRSYVFSSLLSPILIKIARQGLRSFAKIDIMESVVKVHRGPEVRFRTELFEKVKVSPILQYDLQGYLDTIPLRRMTNPKQ